MGDDDCIGDAAPPFATTAGENDVVTGGTNLIIVFGEFVFIIFVFRCRLRPESDMVVRHPAGSVKRHAVFLEIGWGIGAVAICHDFSQFVLSGLLC